MMDRLNQAIVSWTREQEERTNPGPHTRCLIVTLSDVEHRRERDAFISPPKPKVVVPPTVGAPKGPMSNLSDAFFACLRYQAR